MAFTSSYEISIWKVRNMALLNTYLAHLGFNMGGIFSTDTPSVMSSTEESLFVPYPPKTKTLLASPPPLSIPESVTWSRVQKYNV